MDRDQLPLALPHAPDYSRDSYFAGACNAAGLSLVELWPNWPTPVVVLSGPAGSGKTHLAHIWAERAGARLVAGASVDTTDAAGLIGSAGALALEDIDGQALGEQALFHLLNSLQESGGTLLITARHPPAQWGVALPDLRSRLRLATPAALSAPDEHILRQVLVKLFADRQVSVERSVVDFILTRMERSFGAAIAIVDALDAEALATASRITRPMAARILAKQPGTSTGEFLERQ